MSVTNRLAALTDPAPAPEHYAAAAEAVVRAGVSEPDRSGWLGATLGGIARLSFTPGKGTEAAHALATDILTAQRPDLSDPKVRAREVARLQLRTQEMVMSGWPVVEAVARLHADGHRCPTFLRRVAGKVLRRLKAGDN